MGPTTEKQIHVRKSNSLLAIVALRGQGASGTTKPGVMDNLPGLNLICLSDPSTCLALPHERALSRLTVF